MQPGLAIGIGGIRDCRSATKRAADSIGSHAGCERTCSWGPRFGSDMAPSKRLIVDNVVDYSRQSCLANTVRCRLSSTAPNMVVSLGLVRCKNFPLDTYANCNA